jgi:tetratricopeptide (TPR) repeat protein
VVASGDALQEMVALMQQAVAMRTAGDREKALDLVEQAIRIGGEAGIDVTQAKVQKALLTDNERDFSSLLAVAEEGLDYYVQQGDLVEQINMLINLTGIHYHAGRRDEAVHYLDRVEALIESLTPEQIGHMDRRFPPTSQLTAELFLELRQAEVRRIRKVMATDSD